jgi:hypothetical protein
MVEKDVFIEGISNSILTKDKHLLIINNTCINIDDNEFSWGVNADLDGLLQTAEFIIGRLDSLLVQHSLDKEEIYKKFARDVVYFLEPNFRIHIEEVRNWVIEQTKNEKNIIKEALKLLDMTYKQLGLEIGVSDSTLKSIVSTGKISNQIQKSIELLIKNKKLAK